MQKKVLRTILMVALILSLTILPVMADTYEVQSGDVLWKIAKDNNISIDSLVDLNNLTDPNMIYPGQMLKLSGENLAPFTAETVKVVSRGVEIPAIFTYPNTTTKMPLVVMAHGHGGSKDEAGGYIQLAESLANQGIASIRMDFPGCGDSTESFSNNTLTNMLMDIEASLQYALASGKVDEDNVFMMGYSMGGRLAMLSVSENPIYKAMGSWAPAATNGPSSMYIFMGGQEAFETYSAEAKEKGTYLFTTLWGQEQLLSKEFFVDMETSTPIDAVKDYAGPVLIVNGSKDDIITADVVSSAMVGFENSQSVWRYTVMGADHGFGIFSNEPNLTKEAVDTTVNFFKMNIK